MEQIINDLLTHFPDIRYVAIYQNQKLMSRQRSGLASASDSDSDQYEELLVNPALLTLARQRGDIDCGGLRYIIVAYGNFFQLVREISKGHLSICLPHEISPATMAEAIFSFYKKTTPGFT